MIVVRRTVSSCHIPSPRDRGYHDLVAGQPIHCPPESMRPDDPLFITYPAGPAGKPERVVHTIGTFAR